MHTPHKLRMLADGRWVCSGGFRALVKGEGFTGGDCTFSSREYVDAVNHATERGAVPPDMPRVAA